MKRGKRNNFLMGIQRDNFGLAIYKHKYSYQTKTTYHYVLFLIILIRILNAFNFIISARLLIMKKD